MSRTTRVIVVGAGPVGVAAALDASRRGFRVTLLESQGTIDSAPRAATFHPSTLEMVARLGVWDEFVAAGLVARMVDFWDKPSRTLVARFDHAVLQDDTEFPFVVQTEQHKLVDIALRRLVGQSDVAVHLSTAVTGVRQTADSVTVTAVGPEGERTFEGDFVVGCDGGRSTVRKAVGVEFEGFTWPERFVVLTARFDVQRVLDCSYRNYFADPQAWANLFKVAGDDGLGRWRAVSPTGVSESDGEAVSDEQSAQRLGSLVPEAGIEDLVHRNVYHVHQRVASRFRAGRVFLAGDAAHVNNPIGGLGLNCGVHDAVELMDTLELMPPDRLDESLLDRYERRRRPLIIEFVQDQTIANKRRLEEQDPSARLKRQRELRDTAADPKRHREFLLRSSLIASVRRSREIA